jgi:hypothetical protein
MLASFWTEAMADSVQASATEKAAVEHLPGMSRMIFLLLLMLFQTHVGMLRAQLQRLLVPW